MEQTNTQCLVKELDLTLQPRIAPRYKTWLPLVTQQLRLRSLIQIIGHKLKNDSRESCLFYYTIHRTSMSSPLYTSEPIDNTSPRWASLEVPTLHGTGHANSNEIIIRVWKRTVKDDPATDKTLFTWGISFTGLAFIGAKLPNNLDNILRENALIFHIHGGYFVPPFCLFTDSNPKKFLAMSVNTSEVKDSYTVNKLCTLRSKMQALKQQTDSVKNLRERIASGESFNVPKYPLSSLNRLLQPKKINREKKAEIIKIKKDLEVAKFRAKLLEQERVRKMGEVRTLNQCHLDLMEKNQDHSTDLMGRYQDLNKDIERLHEWRQNHIDSREIYIQTTACLAHRRRQLIYELNWIYPIKKENEDIYLINEVHLPDSEKLETANDTQVAVALGFVAHTTQMIANFLNVPTRYPIVHYGSRSKIIDHIQEHLPDPNRQFPLFARSKDKLQFNYAVYLLNKNIAQLRWYCGLPTMDLRATLPNLSGLINVKPNHNLDNSKRTFSGSSLDVDAGNNKSNIPLTPPLHKTVLDKYHKTTRSMSHFKGNKTLLGASLDQGLNQPSMQQQSLSKQIKRICKSEDSAIDNVALSMPSNTHSISLSSISSEETINESIFDNKNNTLNRTNSNNEAKGENSNAIVALSDIEIMVPMSVSKPKFCSDNTVTPVATRQRSSNSISSCEMALSSSLVDGEDSSNGNLSIKNDDVSDGIFKQEDPKSGELNSSTNDHKNFENKSKTEQTEEEVNEAQSPLNKVTDSSHSTENVEHSEIKQNNFEDKSEEPCVGDSVKCDTNLSLTAESFQAQRVSRSS